MNPILWPTICVHSATHVRGTTFICSLYFFFTAIHHDFLCPTSQLSRQSNSRSNPKVVGSIPNKIIRKKNFFTSCGFLIPFTRANAQWVFMGFTYHFNLHFRVNSLFHQLCSQCYAAQHLSYPLFVKGQANSQMLSWSALAREQYLSCTQNPGCENRREFEKRRLSIAFGVSTELVM